MKLSRREFVKTASLGALGLLAGNFWPRLGGAGMPPREALFYQKALNQRVECRLCPRYCVIDNGSRGNCGVRENRRGKLYSLVYGKICARHLDPIEKKPFFHFLPGSLSYSFATAGCNLHCAYCQNWDISQARPEAVDSEELLPFKMLEIARENGAQSLAGTYSEPTIFYEYLLEIARTAKTYNLPVLMVSSGFINPEPLELLCRHLKGIKIDFKSFSRDFYANYCSGKLEPVLNSMKIIKKAGVWLEIVNLAIPTLNDGNKEFLNLCSWIKHNLGLEVPLHFTAFYPMYKLKNLPPTSPRTLMRAREIALKEGLKYVYTGNLPGFPGENTYCPQCGKIILERKAYLLTQNQLIQGKCRFCGEHIPGYWNQASQI